MASIESMTVQDLGNWLESKGYRDEIILSFEGELSDLRSRNSLE